MTLPSTGRSSHPHGTKKPTCSGRSTRQSRATEARLTKWFGNGQDVGLAVVFGPVSGGLVCRDFDTMEGYERWAADHPDLAKTLPTVATARGRHVYCRANHRGIKKLDDGELRGAATACSRQADTQTARSMNGSFRRPMVAAPYCRRSRGWFSPNDACNRENGEYRENGSNLCCLCCLCYRGDSKRHHRPIEKAIVESLPIAIGRRNRQIFELARALKAIPALADAPVDALEPHVRRWHNLGVARGVIGTEPFTETWIDFFTCWPKVRFPKGTEPMVLILERAKQSPPPKAAERYEQAELRLLVSVCRELQHAAGAEPFYLACRTAAELLDVRNKQGGFDHVKAWRWLLLLAHDGIVEATGKGDQSKHRATRYRYRGD